MKCPKCGKEISNDSQFCEYCGTQLEAIQKVVQGGLVHVRWLLYVATLLLCCMNVLLFYKDFVRPAFGEYSYFDTSTLWFVPVLLLAIFVIGFVLSIKKKLKGIYVFLLFMTFGINMVIPITAEAYKGSSTDYTVSLYIYENGEYVGGLSDHCYDNRNYALRNEEVLNSMVKSASRKYRDSIVRIERNSAYRDSIAYIENITYIFWVAETLVLLVYLIIASVANREEKKCEIINQL